MSSVAAVGDTLNIYELSNLPLDSLSWNYDRIAFQSLNNTSTLDYILYLEAFDKGMYNVALQAYSGGCVSKVVKQVEVLDSDTTQNKNDNLGYKKPLITKLIVAPNPSDGNFSLIVELRDQADIHVDIYSVNEARKVHERNSSSLKEHTVKYQLSSLNTGVYLIVVTAENERKQLKILVK